MKMMMKMKPCLVSQKVNPVYSVSGPCLGVKNFSYKIYKNIRQNGNKICELKIHER